jgi:hypothetical protein
MPMTAYYVWLLIGMMLLRFRPLMILVVVTATAQVSAVALDPPMTGPRVTSLCTLFICLALILFASSRQQSGLPGPMGEAMLTDLRGRLQSQGTIPALPVGWQSQSAMVAASGVGYGGDFIVASTPEDGSQLELILVDVTGKGVQAASRALQFGGALGGLIGALPPQGLFAAANDFLLRQDSDDTFATAVHVVIDLETGIYQLSSAGHPPALVWSSSHRTWTQDPAHGTALGITPRPDMEMSTGRLHPGDALMLYTDGVVESRLEALDEGVAWLQREAKKAVANGFGGAAHRILAKVNISDDDRAVLILERSPQLAAPAAEESGVETSLETSLETRIA